MKLISTVALSLMTSITAMFNSKHTEATPTKIIAVEPRNLINLDSKDSIFILNSYDKTLELSKPVGFPLDIKDMKCKCKNLSEVDSKRFCSGFGYRYHPILKIKRFHSGIDFSAKEGVPIKSTMNGKIKKVSYQSSGYGKYLIITSGDYETLFAHASKILVKEGQEVTIGDTIALVGSTGLATGPHVHYEVHKDGKVINPEQIMKKD